MASVGTGYDLYASTYSPDGRLFQIEYASKAVDNSGTAVGIRFKDGVVLGAEIPVVSRMVIPGSQRRIHSIAKHIGLGFGGFIADSRQLVNRGREEATAYLRQYGRPIPVRLLAERIGAFMQVYTRYASARPFGCAVLIAGVDEDKTPQLYVAEPSGVTLGYYGAAVGKGRQSARNELGKLDSATVMQDEAMKEAARIIYAAHDEARDKDFELEVTVVTSAGLEHRHVTDAELAELNAYAKQKLEEEDEEEGEDPAS